MIVDAFIPCFIDQFYPETAASFIAVLEKAGCKVNYNPEQTCCGQPAFNGGYWKEAKTVAEKFLNDFGKADIVVAPSASCTGFIRNYYHKIFSEEKDLLERSNQLSKKVFEFSDFLVNHLNVSNFGAVFNHKVTLTLVPDCENMV